MIMKNTIFAIIIAILAVGGGWYYYNFTQYAPKTYVKSVNEITKTETGSATTTPTNVAVNTVTGETTKIIPLYALTDISSHNNTDSCYSAISGSVYDLTMFVNIHPGGKSAILSICGKDGTDAFMNQHRGGSKFMKILTRYKIGNLIVK